jgi:hypothetical protein
MAIDPRLLATLENAQDDPDDADDDEPLGLLDPKRDWPRPWMRGVLAAMQDIPSIARAAEKVGVDRTTVHRGMQQHEEFALAVSAARDQALDNLEATLYLRATAGQQVTKTVTRYNNQGDVVEETVTDERHVSDTLGMFYLKRWRPEYRESFKIEQTGAGGGPIQIEYAEKQAEDFDDRLAAVERRLAEQAAEPV